ncbi:MAG TPA: hypothetical protein VFT04_00960 [Gemmatimonadales bacterium]|nr:hypothetical protein [Gemmatimonadales bacterium]
MQLQKDIPDHHDADLILKLYELRREPVMRESRSAINRQFWPASAEEALAVLKSDHPLNAAFRQVSGYWEMAYGMARHGIVHAEYLVENNTEGMFFFARLQPYLEAIRATSATPVLVSTQWVAEETAMGRSLFAAFRARVEKALASRAP